jgi:xanthine dehydrogenase accessory factor
MREWLAPLSEALARGQAAVLVHLVELKGSGPREAGAQMLVTEDAIIGTIGGGELERTAMLKARELIHSGGAALERYALGPELNQCCGGSVTVAFEPFAPADRAWVAKLVRAGEEPIPAIRTLSFDISGRFRRDWSPGDDDEMAFAVNLEGDQANIRERINPAKQALWLFGAGHVGRALAPALQPLGFAMTWIDGRTGQFPEPPLADVKQLELAMPELAVDEAPPNTIFLVMTHSHPLDEAVCEAILRREDFAYLGLIGSDTKRARFVKRLGEAGIPPAQLKRLTCPIGLSSIASKEPAAIAASVAADLLIRREQGALKAKGAVLRGG